MYEIFMNAIEEVENISYETMQVKRIRDRNGYLIRGVASTKSNNPMTSATALKKKFTLFSKFLDVQGFTPVNIKNSKTLYDLIALELKFNDGFDINQRALRDFMEENNKKGSIEHLNMHKKSMKDKFLFDIIEHNNTFF